jgi:hypothetical protein
MKRFALCIIIGAVLGCDVPSNLRYMESPSHSVIGISLTVKLYNALQKMQSSIYFVKLDDKDENNLGTKLIRCNYYRGTMAVGYYAFLVNAVPGRYAAVCSSKYDKLSGSDNPAGTTKDEEYGFITFFDSNMIQKTVTEVGPGQIVFMGSYTVDSQLKSVYKNIEKNGDKAQQHYYNQLKPFMEGTYFCGSLLKADRSEKLTRDFLVTAKNYFRNSEWLKIINAAITEFDKAAEGKMI